MTQIEWHTAGRNYLTYRLDPQFSVVRLEPEQTEPLRLCLGPLVIQDTRESLIELLRDALAQLTE